MASDDGNKDGDRTEASHGPRECMPCRGTGRVISNLGGSESKVPCPWCRGEGVRVAEVDAQERWLGGEAQAGARTSR
jgi:DnaJ-class molecular chaperone